MKTVLDKKQIPVTLYFALSLFSIMNCEFLTTVRADRILAAGPPARAVYAVYSVSVAIGVWLLYLGKDLLSNQKRRGVIFVSVFTAAVPLIVFQANVETPALFWSATVCLYILAGFNTGAASFLLYGLYLGEAPVGRILAVASLAGLSLHYALCRALAGNPHLPSLLAGFTAASVAVLLFLLLRKLPFAQPETPAETAAEAAPSPSGGAKGLIAPKIAAVVLISWIIGLSDSLVARSVPLRTVGGAFFYPVLFYIPGQVIACLIADIKNGKYINLVTFISAILLTPVALLLETPEELYRRAGLNYFFGGFFLMYIMTVLISAARDSRNARLTVCLPGMLYPLFCGIGGFWGPMISASLDRFAVLAVYSAMLAALALLTFGEALVRKKETRSPPKETFARYRFTERETEVLFLLIDGLSSSDIAARLFISEKTVRNHVSNMLAKTDCASRGDLILLVKGL